MDNIEKLKELSMNDIVDISNISFNKKLNKKERIIDYINKIKNPYCYKCNGYKVILVFDEEENSVSLEEILVKNIDVIKRLSFNKKI